MPKICTRAKTVEMKGMRNHGLCKKNNWGTCMTEKRRLWQVFKEPS